MKQTLSQAFRPYPQVLSLFLATWASLGPAPGIAARSSRTRSRPVIRVGIYNYAHIGRADLCEAERQTADLFALAGVRIAWVDYTPKGRPIRSREGKVIADFYLRILPASMSVRCNSKTGAMGESVITSRVRGPLPGGIANVFYGLVKEVTSMWSLYSGDVLGGAPWRTNWVTCCSVPGIPGMES
jgi:hypothetical protein